MLPSRTVILAEYMHDIYNMHDHSTIIQSPPPFYFFYLHTTIRLKYMVLFHLFFLLCTTIRPRLAHDHSTKMYLPLSFILSFAYEHSTKIRVLIDVFLLFVPDHSTKFQGPLSFLLSLFCGRPFDQKLGSSLISLFHLYTTIRPKLRVPINLMFLFVHDYSTKNQGPH